MSNFRFRWQQQGGHVHVRLFVGKRPDQTHGKSGDLVFSPNEWAEFRDAQSRAGFEISHESERP